MNESALDVFFSSPQGAFVFFTEQIGFSLVFYGISWLILRPKELERTHYKVIHHLLALLTVAALQTLSILLFPLPEGHSRTISAIVWAMFVVGFLRVFLKKGR